MRGNLVSPTPIWKTNSSSATNVLSTTSDPVPDMTVDTEGSTYEDSGRSTMNFKSFYESSPDSLFAPLDKRGYSSGNVINDDYDTSTQQGQQRQQQGSTSSVFGGLEDNDSALFLTGNPSVNKTKAVDKGGSKPTRSIEDDNPWMVHNDPMGGGRSFLLRQLKAKFLEVTTPITRFVSRYLAEKGDFDESKLHEFIRIRPLFSIAEQTHDWEGLIHVLYGGGSTRGLPGGSNSPLMPFTQEGVSGGLSKEELANTLLHLVSVEEAHRRAMYDSNREEDVTKQAAELVKILQSKTGLTARMLRHHYDNTVSGKVVFLLHPILREAAQSLLDAINERWRTTMGKSKFTLLEVMNSDSVLTVFIKLMNLSQHSTNMGGVTGILPVTNNALGGAYGTLGDRVTAGSASYQKKTYGNTTVVQSRPSVANMVSTSIEYAQGMWYFAHVEKNRRGGLSLISELDNNRGRESSYSVGAGNDWMMSDADGYQSNSYPRLYYDSSRDIYQTKDNIKKYNMDHSKVLLPTRPIETIKSAIQRMGGNHGNSSARYQSLSSYDSNDYDGYDPHILSYIDRTGKMKYVKREIVQDQRAMQNFYLNGELSEKYIIGVNHSS
jgi:hypothetical protein